MSWGVLLLLAGVSSPALKDGDANWLRSHYPGWAIREGKSAATFIEAVIEPDGKMHDCKVVGFVGDERLAAQECEILARFKFRPAIGPDGAPTRGKYRNLLKRVLSGPQASLAATASKPDMTLTVNRLRKGTQTLDLEIDLLVDAAGSAAACNASSEYDDENYAPFVRFACAEALKLKFAPLTQEAGQSTEYVTNVRVRFVTEMAVKPDPQG